MISNKIKGLGEVILRVKDMNSVKRFYKEIIGLELIHESDNFTFFKIAEGYGGHTQTLALFSKNNPTAFGDKLKEINVENSTLHHFALEIDKNDYGEILNSCIKLNLEYTTEVFEWVKWKSIFLKDPEKNIVELVCYDKSIS